MKLINLKTTVALACIGMAALGLAQTPPFVQVPETYSKWMLLDRKDVAAELKLTQKQISDVHELAKKASSGEAQICIEATSMEEAMAQIEKRNHEIDSTYAPKFRKLIDADQEKRLGQIELQLAPYQILLRDDVSKLLKLSAAQTSKLRDFWEPYMAETAEYMPQGPPEESHSKPTKDVVRALRKLNAKYKKTALAILDKGQVDLWGSMTGPAFKEEGEGL